MTKKLQGVPVGGMFALVPAIILGLVMGWLWSDVPVGGVAGLFMFGFGIDVIFFGTKDSSHE